MFKHTASRLSTTSRALTKSAFSAKGSQQSLPSCRGHQLRQLSITSSLKKKKHAARSNSSGNTSSSTAQAIENAPIRGVASVEAFDFSIMERNILKKIENLTHKLADIKSGGALNPAVLESLQVQPDKKSDDLVKLSDVAQVVTRGRHINVILSDPQLIKAVKSAIQGSNLSLTPQGPTDEAPTTLVINMPPPTGESRQAALDSVTKLYNSTLDRIREARQEKHKELRAMQLAKTANPDELQKANKEMEQIIKKFSEEVKTIVETHKRIIAR